MFGMGPEKIVLLAIVVLLLFGAKRIPEIGSSFGKGIREFKKSLDDASSDTPAHHAELRAPAGEMDVPPRVDANEQEWQPRRLGS
jgi:sec-independent protein translocase protein TatA